MIMEEISPNIAQEADEVSPLYGSMSGTSSWTTGAEQLNGKPMVTCRVCQALIDISGKENQHVVNCAECHEATQIRNALPGKKYVRCPCNCLLTCRATSRRIACPRPSCNKIYYPTPNPTSPAFPSVPGMCHVTCAHCDGTFLFFKSLTNASARCPHCRRVSSVGPDFARKKAASSLVLSIVFIAVGVGVTWGTYHTVVSKVEMYVVYVGAFLVALILFIRSIYYWTMKVGVIEGPI